jgi:hypothetical protein
MILKTAVRARVIAINPAEGVRIPKHNTRANPSTIRLVDFFEKLLPAVPVRYQGLVCLAALGGLRWVSAPAWRGERSTLTTADSRWSRSRSRHRPLCPFARSQSRARVSVSSHFHRP